MLVSLLIFSLPLGAVSAQETDSKSGKFGPEVVAKAEKILGEAGLRRAGKSIQASDVADISRGISGLAREKRVLRLVNQEWKVVADQLATIRQQLKRMNVQYGEYNLQLARVAQGDVTTNNRIVGLLNATNAKMKVLAGERERVKEELAKKREALSKAESAYAETVLAIRSDFVHLRDKLATAMTDEQVLIALRVMHANFQTPQGLTADKILASLDKRIQRVEQEVFSESIPLEVERGSLYVDVVVGRKPTRMVVDSGASLISLPMKTATELGISVPVDARVMKLILADGRSIPARGVTLPKVRVGEFEAVNVEAAVLDAVASDAEPLLGMSFLGNFKFEINTADKTLKMLRIKAE